MKRAVQTSIGLVLGLLMLWLLFRDTNWTEVGNAFKQIDLKWIIITQIPLWLTFPIRVQRWTYIVRVDKPDASFRHLFSATQIGFLANFTLPARAGEAIRALVLNRLEGIPFFKGFAMVGLDRVTDILGLIVVMFVAILAFQPTADVIIPAETFGTDAPIVFTPGQYQALAVMTGAMLVVIVGGFVALYVNRRLVLRISDAILGLISKTIAARIHEWIDHFADGLHIFKSPLDMAKSVAFGMGVWFCSLISLYCVTRAFVPDFPWYLPFVMQAILSVAIAAPGAPGFVGQFHVPIVITLVMLVPDINVDHAKAAAILIHLLQLPPVAGLGIWCLMRENVGLFELQREAQQAEEQADHPRDET